MVIKTGRFGSFISCSGYPECKTTKPIVKDTGAKCPKDGGMVLERRSRRAARSTVARTIRSAISFRGIASVRSVARVGVVRRLQNGAGATSDRMLGLARTRGGDSRGFRGSANRTRAKIGPRRRAASTVVGGGLARCEAAWQAARRGVEVGTSSKCVHMRAAPRIRPASSRNWCAAIRCAVPPSKMPSAYSKKNSARLGFARRALRARNRRSRGRRAGRRSRAFFDGVETRIAARSRIRLHRKS